MLYFDFIVIVLRRGSLKCCLAFVLIAFSVFSIFNLMEPPML